MIYYDSFKPLCSPYFCTIRYVIVHKYNTCTATDRYCCSITDRNYLERRAETEEKVISWQDWKFHMATVRVIFSAVGGTAVYCV